MDKTKSRKCNVGSKAAKAVTVPVNKKGSAAPAPKKRRNEAAVPIGTALANATAVGATKNKIVVTRVTSENAPGRYVRTEERLYYDQTPRICAGLRKAVLPSEKSKARGEGNGK